MTEQYSEQIIDSFLEELVTQQSPPDLSARIALAWERERQQTGDMPVVATPVKSPASGQHLNQVSSHVKLRALRRKRQGTSFRRNVIAALLAISACGLLAFLGSRLLVKHRQASDLLAGGDGAAIVDDQLPARPAGNGLDANTGLPPTVPVKSVPPTAVVPLDIADLPFALDAPVRNDGSVVASGDRHAPVLGAQQTLTDVDIVRHIDQQLLQLWQDLNVVPTAPVTDRERLEQAAQRLTGQPLTSAGENLQLPDLIQQATASRAFAGQWADKLIQAWFARSSLPVNDARIVAARQQIATFINSGQPFNRLAVELLGGEMAQSVQAPDAPAEPASLTSTFVSALAGNGNHRLVARIGTSFLDANLTCVRCHEANATSPATSAGFVTDVARQEVYWSLVALFQGIEVQGGNSRERLAIDRQLQQLASGKPLVAYYDLLDGRLQAAQPILPGGQAWEQVATESSATGPRQALALWLSQSTYMDEATVNQVWKIVMGRPLVPQIAWQSPDPREELAARERRSLQLFLANQYRNHGRDLKRLVGWVVGSEAFGRQPVELNHAQWLDASDAKLRQLQLAESNFAAGPQRTPTAEAGSLESSLATVIKWQGSKAGSANETTLAQPAPNLPSAEKKRLKAATKQARTSMPTTSYALHGEQPAPPDVTFVSRLLASRRLSWQQCVEHVVLVNPTNALNGRIKHLADELLKQHSGDAQAALLDLLWAVKNSDSI